MAENSRGAEPLTINSPSRLLAVLALGWKKIFRGAFADQRACKAGLTSLRSGGEQGFTGSAGLETEKNLTENRAQTCCAVRSPIPYL